MRILALTALLALGGCVTDNTKAVLEMMKENCAIQGDGHIEGNASLTGAQGANSFNLKFNCLPTNGNVPPTLPAAPEPHPAVLLVGCPACDDNIWKPR